jgi:4-hydroxy-3-methylbut-2-en-1-yl diphosphate reductase
MTLVSSPSKLYYIACGKAAKPARRTLVKRRQLHKARASIEGPETAMRRGALTIRLAGPRGFCAGVDRAIRIVELALEKGGAPVYVRHEIVHNRTVVEALEKKGAVFVEELDQVPDGVAVVFSAHGVPRAVIEEAARRDLVALDATCPLVTKVHVEAARWHREGRIVILIGHAGHPEVIGTMGQLPQGAVVLVERESDVAALAVADPERLAYVTQTTLSVDDTAAVIARLRARFPAIAGPRNEDICYATTNRQTAVKAIAPGCDGFVVLGAPNSSNSNRLVEVARAAGCAKAMLIERAADLDPAWLENVAILGVSAGASAPEILVEELIAACRARFEVTVEPVTIAEEDIVFSLPRALSG